MGAIRKMNRKQPISLIVLLFVLVSIGAGYSQNGAVYLLRITEGNVANTNVNWEIDWYEHTNK